MPFYRSAQMWPRLWLQIEQLSQVTHRNLAAVLRHVHTHSVQETHYREAQLNANTHAKKQEASLLHTATGQGIPWLPCPTGNMWRVLDPMFLRAGLPCCPFLISNFLLSKGLSCFFSLPEILPALVPPLAPMVQITKALTPCP